MSDYEKQLEEANETLQRKVEDLEIRLSWEAKTKDLRELSNEYYKMDKEIFSVNKDRLVSNILALDTNSILDMWSNGYRISTAFSNDMNDVEFGFFPRKRYSVTIVGPHKTGQIQYDKKMFFGVQLSVSRSFFYPLTSDKCFLIMEHNRICDFSGAIAESVHNIDRKFGECILNLIRRIDVCKYMMNGKLLMKDCYIKLDTFRNPWTDIPEVNP